MGDQQGRLTGRRLKIIELTNVDFSLRHFLVPLMRAARAQGHEVVGACAEGPLNDDLRAEGFRIVAIPFARRVSPIAHIKAFVALVRMLRAEKPDLLHAHMPISGFLARWAAWCAAALLDVNDVNRARRPEAGGRRFRR